MKHHDFQPTTLTHFTYCDRCRRFIWGLRNQALSCSACGFVCHLACGADPALICERKEELSKSPAEQALKKLQKLDDDQRYTSGEKQHEDQPNSDLHPESHPNVHPHPHLPVPNTKHAAIRFIEDLILEATLEADNRPVSEYVLNPPALNAQTTAKNFTRFIARCSFVFELRDSFILLLSWNNSMHTWLALLSYCYLCLHPVWLLLTPQAFMIYIITRNHTQRNDQNHKQSICPPEYRKSSPQTSSKGAPASPADYPTLSTPWNVASYLFAMSEDSPEYRRNLQNIQNMMGDFSDLYDYCASYAHYTSWSCESCTSLALQLVIFSGLVTVAFIYILPLKQIMLFSGVFVFFLNTRFVKSLLLIAHSNEWPTQILAEIRTRYRRWTIDSASTHRDIRPVSIYENQRWHDGRGFTHELLAKDARSAWSNISGAMLEGEPNLEKKPPQGFRWCDDSKWKIDEEGPWVDTYLSIGTSRDSLRLDTIFIMTMRTVFMHVELAVRPGKDGWMYADDDWNHLFSEPADSTRMSRAVTRRRRWFRESEQVHTA